MSPESHAPINGPALSTIAKHNQQAIQKRDRPVVTLCSGRPIGFVECLCRLLHNTVIPCIGENGVSILEIDPNRTAGIGDTMGDRFIADRVSWFGCPANAEAEVNSIRFTGSSDHGIQFL